MTLQERIPLLAAKVQIMGLKHDHYQWWTSFTDEERTDLEQTLAEINKLLKPEVQP